MRSTRLAGRRSTAQWVGGTILTGVLLAAGTVAIAFVGGGRHKRGPGDYAAGPPATPAGTDQRAVRAGRAPTADGDPGEPV